MPIVSIMMLEGRSLAQKKAMYKAVTDALVESLGAPRECVGNRRPRRASPRRREPRHQGSR